MGKSHGYRSRTRYMFARDFRRHGAIPLGTYMTIYHVGDIVDIKANGAVQKGMPHKYYQGRTGVVFNVTRSSVGVLINKTVGNRQIEKRVNLKIEHVKHSKCRQEFLERVKINAQRREHAKKTGEPVQLKRQPAVPREATKVIVHTTPETVTPVAYETYI